MMSSCALDNNHNNVLLGLSPGSVSCIFEGQLILAPLEEVAMLMLTVYRLNCQNRLQSQTLHATSIIWSYPYLSLSLLSLLSLV